jgi:hypothetical protein
MPLCVPGAIASNTGRVEVIATRFSTSTRIVSCTSGPLISMFRMLALTSFGHTSGFLLGEYSEFASRPCSKLSMPISAASL